MTGTILELSDRWNIEDQIGDRSGMATVYRAVSDEGLSAAVKFIPKTPGALRELLFESLSGSEHILPIIDTGETETHFLLVMPLADKSLRGHLNDSGGSLSAEEAIDIITQITTALESLEAKVVHRDLKPENILWFEGRWCIADFGIARYAEASTDVETHKYVFTWPYAAPEQWRHERSTSRTDIYALGVIAYELIKGEKPFQGPDFRLQHIESLAPAMQSGNVALDAIVADCLRKNPNARPTAARIKDRLKIALIGGTPAMNALRAADSSIAHQEAKLEAIASGQQSAAKQRQELFQDASEIFKEITNRLVDAALENSTRIKISSDAESICILELGLGKLVISRPRLTQAGVLGQRSGPYSNINPFDVIGISKIQITQHPKGGQQGIGREHSLWYCDAHVEDEFRWFEMSFMNGFSPAGRSLIDPYALEPEKASVCFQRIMSTKQLAWKPMPFDQERVDAFIERWISWFAQAAEGKYHQSSHSPDSPSNWLGRFRNS